MTAKECIRNRRSIRHFNDRPIEMSVLKDIVETASYSPSWKNTQVTRYIAVHGELKDVIANEVTSSHIANGQTISNASLVIAITVIKNRCGYERDGSFTTSRKDTWQMYDAGIASDAFCLAAYEQGIGSVIIGIFDREKIQQLLNLSEDQELVSLIAIGYPEEQPIAPKRRTVDELLTYM